MLHMGFSHPSEVNDAAARDLDEIADAAGGHRLADEIEVGVLVPLTLANGGLDG